MDKNTVNVISTGNTLADHTEQDTVQGMKTLFKISDEKAAAYIGARRTIKTGLTNKEGLRYKTKLEGIGLEIELEPVVSQSFKLALEPMPGAAPEEQGPASSEQAEPEPTKSITCPKCNLTQPTSEQCSGCGVYINKLLNTAAASNPQPEEDSTQIQARPNNRYRARAEQDDTVEPDETPNLNIVALGAAALTALAGAWIWKFIVVTFEFELGLIAWGIGGAIGLVAAMKGAKGMASGVACGIFALVAILGGKYMATSALQQEFLSSLTQSMAGEAMQVAYDEELDLAQYYSNEVHTDEELKTFMIENMYTEADDFVSDTELSEFKLNIAPELTSLANNPPGAEQWAQATVSNISDQIPTWDIIKDNLDWLDYLFLFLGVSTAFRLGQGQEFS